MMKRKNRIGRLLISVLLLFFCLSVLLLLIGGYFVHSRDIDNLYKEQAGRLSVAATSFMDGDFLHQLRDLVSSGEYQKLRSQAVEEKNPSLLEDCLKANGLYEDYTGSMDNLRLLRDSAQVESFYVLDLEDEEDATVLLDPDESILSLGLKGKKPDVMKDLTANTSVSPMVVKSKDSWLCFCAQPVLSSDKSSPAVISSIQNMDEVMKTRNLFVLGMVTLSIAILALATFFGSIFIRRMVSDPISDLAQKAGAFGRQETKKDLMAQVIEVPARRDDEILDLYLNVRDMQLGILRYMDNLTAATEEKERIGTELDIANRIQASMLPNTFPAFPDRHEFEVYALMKPAKAVAGDFYDFFLIDDDHLGIIMADVSGKGIPASLFMMMSKIVIANIAQLGILPHEVLEQANNRICLNNDANMFVTVWFGIMTLSTGNVIASNAGHEFPVLQNKDGAFELLHDRHGFVLGGLEGVRYRDYEFDLDPGQTLFLYTDGVPEATTAENEQFGTDRMNEALNRKKGANPQELVHYMLRTVDDFDGDVPQFDDITMLALRYIGPGQEEKT